jgi:hypothetical protein
MNAMQNGCHKAILCIAENLNLPVGRPEVDVCSTLLQERFRIDMAIVGV